MGQNQSLCKDIREYRPQVHQSKQEYLDSPIALELPRQEASMDVRTLGKDFMMILGYHWTSKTAQTDCSLKWTRMRLDRGGQTEGLFCERLLCERLDTEWTRSSKDKLLV